MLHFIAARVYRCLTSSRHPTPLNRQGQEHNEGQGWAWLWYGFRGWGLPSYICIFTVPTTPRPQPTQLVQMFSVKTAIVSHMDGDSDGTRRECACRINTCVQVVMWSVDSWMDGWRYIWIGWCVGFKCLYMFVRLVGISGWSVSICLYVHVLKDPCTSACLH